MNEDKYIELAHNEGKTVYIYKCKEDGSKYYRTYPIFEKSARFTKYELIEVMPPKEFDLE